MGSHSQQQQQQQQQAPEQTLPAKQRRPPPPTAQSPGCLVPSDYLVPVHICVSAQVPLQPQQQPNVDEQPLVECISWSLFHRPSARAEPIRSVRCQGRGQRKAPSTCSLAEAIQQVSRFLFQLKSIQYNRSPIRPANRKFMK